MTKTPRWKRELRPWNFGLPLGFVIRHSFFRAGRGLLLAVTLLLAPVALRAEEPAAVAPSADELVRRVVARDDAARLRRQEFAYDLTRVTERLDAAGKVTQSKTTRALARPSRTSAFTIEETPDANATAAERAQAAQEAQEGERIQAAMRLDRLANHFQYVVEGRESVDGRDCWVLAYRPKAGAPAGTREERVVNQLVGRFWIDRATDSIVRSEGRLPARVSLAPLVGMNQLAFQFRSQVLPNGDLGPESFAVEVEVAAPFYVFHQRQRSTMRNYRRP